MSLCGFKNLTTKSHRISTKRILELSCVKKIHNTDKTCAFTLIQQLQQKQSSIRLFFYYRILQNK